MIIYFHQTVFNPVQRININDPNAPSLVKEARIIGTPIVLVGHVGWADFAKRWISKKEENGGSDDVKNGGAETKEGADDVVVIDVEACEPVPKAPISLESEANGQNIHAAPASDVLGMSEPEPKHAFTSCGDEPAMNGTANEGAAEVNRVVEMAEASLSDVPNGLEMAPSTCLEENGEATKPEVAVVDPQKPNASVVDSETKAGDEAKADGAKDDTTPNSTAAPKNTEGPPKPTIATTSNDVDSEPLDLSKRDYFLDIKKMIDDIGEEDVPVIKRHYNEEKPIHGNIHAAKFLTNCWPNPDADPEASKMQKTSPNLYLHQWQFPLSDTAGRKLCHQNNPLPKSIMGEDLLKYWLDLPQCKFDSPLQYIFMGREDTLSKLHQDPGGLDISIAPIVGEKECVLVHRADGSNCLYHLQASLNDIDLHQYPLLSQARIWRTTIQPGEILLMPHGTYHQCRNITPCLSYSRFHLDTVNLLPFVQSLINGDAPEIDQEEILWNLTSELITKVDTLTDHSQSLVKQKLSTDDDIPEDMVETVNILRMLRHFVREVARRHEIRQQLKGEDSKDDHCFSTLVDDVDMVS
jgi:hypothetical protein